MRREGRRGGSEKEGEGSNEGRIRRKREGGNEVRSRNGEYEWEGRQSGMGKAGER